MAQKPNLKKKIISKKIICKKALANKPTDNVLSLLGGMAGVAVVEVTLAEGRDLYSTSSA